MASQQASTLLTTAKAIVVATKAKDTHNGFETYQQFHEAMGHLSVPNPTRIYADGHLVLAKPDDFECTTCQQLKSVHHVPTSGSPRHTQPLELIHSDLSGKMPVRSIGGAWYYISFVDDATRHSWIRFLKLKADAPQAIKDFIAYANTQFKTERAPTGLNILTHSIVKTFKSDNGGEYIGHDLQKFFMANGITHELVPPYHHKMNGIPERFNRTLFQITRCIISSDNMLFL